MKYSIAGIFLVVLGIYIGYTSMISNHYGLLVIIALVGAGIFLVVHEYGRSKEPYRINFKMAWSSLSVRFLTLLSIGFVLFGSLNIYGDSFDTVSTIIQLQNEINNVGIQHQSEISLLNQEIVTLQENNSALEEEIQILHGIIEDLQQQESDCQKRLRLYMVSIHGNLAPTGWDSWWESISFTASGVRYSVEIEGDSYSIELKNNEHYSVSAAKKIWFGLRTEFLTDELPLNSEAETLEYNLG